MMVSGLLASSKNNFKIEFEHLNPIENFQDLDLIKKYGFSFGWYSFGKNIHVILKHEKENQIYLAETKLEVEAIINKVLPKLIEDFNVTKKDQKEMCNLLKEQGCCYF
ncbi:MAG: hypothetical protein P8X87_07515 [Candidatus Bathyarchaeota archaeon]